MNNKKDFLFEALRTVLAVLIALVIVFVIIFFLTEDPVHDIMYLLTGPLSSKYRIANVFELMIPLTFTGLAVTVMFRANRFNLAADGAFLIAANVATAVSLFSPFSGVTTIVFAILAGMLAGTVVCGIPAFLKIKFGATELVTSLMLNYIMLLLSNYSLQNILRDLNAGAAFSYKIPKDRLLPVLFQGTRLHAGIIILSVVFVIVVLYINRSKWGYALRITGQGEKFALFSGISVTSVILSSQLIGGAIAGMGGAIEIIGIHGKFQWTDSPGYGFDGVIIATLARNNPAYVPLAAFFLAYLRISADVLNLNTDIPNEIVAIIQAIIIILIAANGFLGKYKHKMIFNESMKKEA